MDADETLAEGLEAAAPLGMVTAVWAAAHPRKIAVVDPDGREHTFEETNHAANQIVRLLRRAGLAPGDGIAIACSNRAEFVEVLAANLRGGFRVTPINWHLTAPEIEYILRDCEARAFFAEARFEACAEAARGASDLKVALSIGGPLAGFEPYETALASFDVADIDDPILGSQMFYTSGTTGRPKGVYRAKALVRTQATYAARGYEPTSVQMCAGPAYHAAPFGFDVLAAMITGSTLVFMDKWNSERTLAAIDRHHVTHMHLVPIMFQRLLSLPDETKAKYDLTSLRYVVHGAAPCPPEVKRAMIDWLGPIVHEYYAGSEGGAGFMIDSHEWLQKPGSVGKKPAVLGSKIISEEGEELPANTPGAIYHQLPPGDGFVYFKDETKTDASRLGDYFTIGDIGYFDDDG